MQTWKEIKKFPGYEVSDAGKVRSKKIGGGFLILKPQVTDKGYHCVTLYRNKKKRRVKVHRLVLETFQGSCPEGHESRHRNGKPWDNRNSNLRWATTKRNHRDKIKHGTTLRGDRSSSARLTSSLVRRCRKLCASGKSNCTLLADKYGVALSTMFKAVKGDTWKYI